MYTFFNCAAGKNILGTTVSCTGVPRITPLLLNLAHWKVVPLIDRGTEGMVRIE